MDEKGAPVASLRDVITADEVRRSVIKDAVRLVDEEVGRKGGVTGLGLRAGYKVFKKFKPGIMQEAVDKLLDEFSDAVDPYYQEHLEAGAEGSISKIMVPRSREVAESLLAITDERARNFESGLIKKTYQKLRPMALRHTEEAVPGVCRMIDKYI
jgi:hypothetical protein